MGFLTLLKWVRTSEANWEDLQFFFKDRKCLERPHRIKDKKIEKKKIITWKKIIQMLIITQELKNSDRNLGKIRHIGLNMSLKHC